MRIATLFLFIFVCFLHAEKIASQNVQLTISKTDSKLEDVLNAIEQQSNLLFVYNQQVNVQQIVSIQVERQSLQNVLDLLFKGTDVSYVVEGNYVLLSSSKTSTPRSTQQVKKKVTGVVTDEIGEPVIGANIIEKGTSNGVISDLDGRFILDNLSERSTLLITYIGYVTREIPVGNRDMIHIQLVEDTHSLDEVVVVGYGVQKKKLVTGSTIQISNEDIRQQSKTSVLGALQGQTPGVNITQTSGMPGEGYKVVIRGMGTIGMYEPLYVIDGVPGGSINNLNPSDIESVDVLKDAASAAIYGARAANGVILVTTRQGKAGKISLSYDGYYGIQQMGKKPKLLNATQYMEILNEARANSGASLYDFASLIPAQYSSIANGTWNGTDWLSEMENNNALIQNHAINLLGGTDQSRFTMGLSYSNQEGVLGYPVPLKSDRYTVRVNSDHVLKKGKEFDMIRIGENLTYSYRERTGIGIGDYYSNDIHNFLVASPLLPAYNSKGDFYIQADRQADNWNLDGGIPNPLAEMVYRRGNNIQKNTSFSSNMYVEIQPVKNLKYKMVFGYISSTESYRMYTPHAELSSTTEILDRVSQSMDIRHQWTWENTLNYSLTLNDVHNMDALAGLSMEKWGMGENMSAQNGNILFPGQFDYAWLSNSPTIAAGVTIVSGGPASKGALQSVFGRINYNYQEKYMLSLIMRGDGSSTFAPGKRWGYFPSVSAGWVLTNESFISPVRDWMDFLKLRASWGQNGNCNVSTFQYLATIRFSGSSSYFFGNDKISRFVGGYADVLPNPNITWETSEQTNIGFDSRFFSSRLGLTFDMYTRKTKDWLVQAPVLLSYGTGAPYINGGDIKNKGFEIVLNWNDRISKDLRYGIGFNLSHNKNKVLRIANSEGIIHGEESALFTNSKEAYRVEVGYPISYFYGYKTAGVFQNEAQIVATKAKYPNTQPGDVIFVDTNGDDSITDDDRVMIGDPNPNFIAGLNANVQFKGFHVAVSASGAFGHQIIKSYRRWADKPFDNYTVDIYDRWYGEGTSNHVPRLTYGAHPNRQNISDLYVEDADYVKFQNITIGYDFKELFPHMPLEQVRLYITGQNLFTLTAYSGMDPEVGYGSESWATGIDVGYFPSPKSFLFGVNLTF